jgi:hypothetical protein
MNISDLRMESIKDLLEITLKNFKLSHKGCQTGGFSLCWTIVKLRSDEIISDDESAKLYDYIYSNPPKEKYDEQHFFHPLDLVSRLNWLNEHIELNK